MILFLLGVFDIIASICVLLQIVNEITFLIVMLLFFKGIWSVISSAAQKFFFDVFGWIDITVSLVFLLNINISWIALLLFVKGAFSVISDL